MQVAAPLALAEVAAVEGLVAVVAVVEISIVVVLVEEKLVAWTPFVAPQRIIAELAVDEDFAEVVRRNLDTVGRLVVELLEEDLAFEGLAACAVAYHVGVVVAYLDHYEDYI